MQVVEYATPAAFLERVTPTLGVAEAENNLLLGVAALVHAAGGRAFLATVEECNELALAALWTPPHRLVLSRATGDSVQCLVDYLRKRGREPAGVLAASDTAWAFAHAWNLKSGASRVAFRERIYELTEVSHPRAVGGQLRLAAQAEVELLSQWSQRFQVDAGLGSVTLEAARKVVEDRVASAMLFVWEVAGAAVSMAALARPTATRVCVNYVYTPDALRSRGYAKSCVAALSARALANGRAACCLFADLANPVSTRVYTAIGYRPVVDVDVLDFVSS